MVRVVLIIYALLTLNSELFAQRDTTLVSVGYFAPYGVQIGGKTALSFNLKSWEAKRENKKNRIHKFNLSPQIGYFIFPKVQHNFLINGEAIYLLTTPTKRLAPFVSVGLGYLIARQRQGGTVSLATGDISYDVKTLHYFTPTFNLGFIISPKKNIGYYLKSFYGRKMTSQKENSALFGLELGLSLKIRNPRSKLTRDQSVKKDK